VSEDNGKTWVSIAATLPDETSYVILEDPTNENILYAGLYRGVYISADRGRSWSLLGPGLAATCISDLVIQEREMDLVAGTHGRGIYIMNLKPIQEALKDGLPSQDILFEPPPARLPLINGYHRYFRLATMEKVPITFYLTKEADVTLAIKNRKGDVIWAKDIRGKKGFNQVRWNLVLKTTDSPEPYFTRYREFAREGEYEIRITGEGIHLGGMLRVINRTSPPR
jgi:hypothetical protein